MNKVSLYSAFILALLSQNIWSQCPAIGCNDNINLSLSNSCYVIVAPDVLSEGDPSTHTVHIYDVDQDTLIGDSLTGAHIGLDLSYKVFNECGNSCWGKVILEYNIIPSYNAPCSYIPEHVVTGKGEIDAFDASDTLMIEPLAPCQDELTINVKSLFALIGGSGTGAVIGKTGGGVDGGGLTLQASEAVINVYDEAGNLKAGPFTTVDGDGEFVVSISGKCVVIIEGDDSSAFGQYDLSLSISDCGIAEECVGWCGSYPEAFVTLEELEKDAGIGCTIPLLGDIFVEKETIGDICDPDGEINVISYYGTSFTHGEKKFALILRQAFRNEKLDLGPGTHPDYPNATTVTPIFFPQDLNIGCAIDASPTGIYTLTGSGTQAWPHFLDLHNYIPDTIFKKDTIHIIASQDTVEKMVLFLTDLDGDGRSDEEVWTLTPVVEKQIVDSVIIDTMIIEGKTARPKIILKDKLCNLVTSYSDDEFIACGGGKKIVRSWTIIDWCNSLISLSDVQTIELIDDEAPVVLQPDDVLVSIEPWTCNATVLLPELDITDNCATEFDIKFNSPVGKLIDDRIIDVPPSDSLMPIELTVSDGCDNYTSVIFNVHVMDQIQPVPICQDDLTVSLTISDGIESEGIAKVFASDFDAGSHDAGCGEVTIKVIRMEDTEDMVWDCEGNELGYKPVTCGPTTEQVDLICELNGSQYGDIAVPGDYVKFCCSDIGRDNFVIVIVTDAFGNHNSCMVSVNVTNKGGGALVCQPVSIGCTEDLSNLELPSVVGGICFGEMNIQVLSETANTTGCGPGEVLREWFVDLDASGDLTPGDAYCEQVITIEPNLSPFDPYTIKWPKHYDGTIFAGFNYECNADLDSVDTEPITVLMGDPFTCSPDNDAMRPVWCDTECGLIGLSVEADTLIAGDACMKIVNRWTVVDWCVWDANTNNVNDDNDLDNDKFIAIEDWTQDICTSCPDYGPAIDDPVYFKFESFDRDGYYTFDQIIKIDDETNPVILQESDTIIVNTTEGSDQKLGERECIGSDVITVTARDFCDGLEAPAEYLKWSIEIVDQYDNPVLNSEGQYTKQSRGASASMDTRSGEPGDVRVIKWRVEDGCGNFGFANTTILFGDERAPTPLCILGLTTVYMDEDNSAVIWAKDFDLGSFDNCTESADLQYAIVPSGVIPVTPEDTSFVDQSGLTILCDTMTSSFLTLDMYVWDLVGNSDFCTVNLLFSNDCIDDNTQTGNGHMISGQVETEEGENIESVMITVASDLLEYPKNVMTSTTGAYAFENNPNNNNFQLSAHKDDNPLNGVSTLDLVLLQKHIVSIVPLSSPYKIIAADVNGDGRISSLDLIDLRKLILGLNNSLSNGEIWKFVDMHYNFPDPQSPWPYVETLQIGNLLDDMMSEDFIGVKMGDVNGSASPNSFHKSEIRHKNSLVLELDEQKITKDQIVKLDITSKDFTEINGMQFSLRHNGLELLHIESGALNIEPVNYHTTLEKTNFSWSEANELSTSSETLFTVVFKSGVDALLSETVMIDKSTNEGLFAEAYRGDKFEELGLNLQYNIATNEDLFYMAQNEPNPFIDKTSISFTLPEQMNITFSIFDEDGKELNARKGAYKKGDNTIELTKADIQTSSGVLYYQIEGEEHSATRKMIVID